MTQRILFVYACVLGLLSQGVTAVTCKEAAQKLKTEDFELTCAKKKPLGAGASGVAYLLQADDRLFVGKVVRFLTKEVKDRFREEIEILTLIPPHRNIIRLYHWTTDYQNGYMLLEYGTLGSLESIIKKKKVIPKSPRFQLLFFLRLLEGVDHIHQEHYVHSDLKPANIVVTEDLEPKVIDFDMALPTRTLLPKIRGTPLYIDPQLLMYEGERYTEDSDIHALGCIFYEMLHGGKPAFDSKNEKSLLRAIIKGDYKIKENSIHWLAAFLIAKSLAIEGKDRMRIPDMIQLIYHYLDMVPDKLTKEDKFPGGDMKGDTVYTLGDFMPSYLVKQEQSKLEKLAAKGAGRKFKDRDEFEWDEVDLTVVARAVKTKKKAAKIKEAKIKKEKKKGIFSFLSKKRQPEALVLEAPERKKGKDLDLSRDDEGLPTEEEEDDSESDLNERLRRDRRIVMETRNEYKQFKRNNKGLIESGLREIRIRPESGEFYLVEPWNRDESPRLDIFGKKADRPAQTMDSTRTQSLLSIKNLRENSLEEKPSIKKKVSSFIFSDREEKEIRRLEQAAGSTGENGTPSRGQKCTSLAVLLLAVVILTLILAAAFRSSWVGLPLSAEESKVVPEPQSQKNQVSRPAILFSEPVPC